MDGWEGKHTLCGSGFRREHGSCVPVAVRRFAVLSATGPESHP